MVTRSVPTLPLMKCKARVSRAGQASRGRPPVCVQSLLRPTPIAPLCRTGNAALIALHGRHGRPVSRHWVCEAWLCSQLCWLGGPLGLAP